MLIRESIGTAITIPFPFGRRRSSTTASSAGSLEAEGSHGTTPKERQPVRFSVKRMPSSNSERSPRNRFIAKPAIIAASCGSITALVPTMEAMTPPRSMSPTSTTGTSAARANPMLAMSPCRRLTSAGLPAPSTITRSYVSRRRSNAARTGASRLPRLAMYCAASSLRSAVPLTTTCALRLPSGFSSTGFMSVEGSSPAARACSAWARPISPPSEQAAALFDMFCGLKGATLIPRRCAMRHRAATRSDLPTSEPVP